MSYAARERLVRHPHLAIYGVGLIVTWAVTILTWGVGPDGHLRLSPVAALLQYALVVLAAALAGDRLRRAAASEVDDSASFGFYDRRWSIRKDMSGRIWWTCVWAGIAAIGINVAILIVAELLIGHADAGLFASWLGAALVAGALIGSFSAVIPVLLGRRSRA